MVIVSVDPVSGVVVDRRRCDRGDCASRTFRTFVMSFLNRHETVESGVMQKCLTVGGSQLQPEVKKMN